MTCRAQHKKHHSCAEPHAILYSMFTVFICFSVLFFMHKKTTQAQPYFLDLLMCSCADMFMLFTLEGAIANVKV